MAQCELIKYGMKFTHATKVLFRPNFPPTLGRTSKSFVIPLSPWANNYSSGTPALSRALTLKYKRKYSSTNIDL